MIDFDGKTSGLYLDHAYIARIFVLLLHASAAFSYISQRIDGRFASTFWGTWALQVALLLGISAALSVFSFVARSPYARGSILVVQTGLFLIGTYGEAGNSAPLLAWGTALAFQGFSLFQVRTASVFSVVVALIAVFFPRADTVWDHTVDARHADTSVLSALYYTAMIYLIAMCTRLRQQARSGRHSREQLRESLLRLTTVNIEYQNYAVAAEQRGTEEERQRITRDIHDTVGYTMTNIIMMTKACEQLIDHDHELLRRLLADAREQCQDALAETRQTLQALRAIKTPTVDFPKQVWKTVRTFQLATGVHVDLEFRNLPRIESPSIRGILHRTVQEGLTNSFRHGHATTVSVLFWYDGRGLSVLIHDDGTGSPKVQEDIGIGGMRERVEPLGGTVQAYSPPGGGFVVRAWIPLHETATATD
ncbi:MAG: sensor histidine kinase [Spirochaetales bacterium]|nr:sensor histidine kinase [Spirochaetales bacterium]